MERKITILSIDDDRIVTSFVEHSHIDTQNC